MTGSSDHAESASGKDEDAATQSRHGVLKSGAVILLVLALGTGLVIAGSQGGVTVGTFPVFGLIVGWIFLVQLLAFIPAWTAQTEKYFDLVGSLTYVTAIVGAVVLSGHTDTYALLLAGAVVVWAGRLGTFLSLRVRRAGSDDRFDSIKPDFARFLSVWMVQGLWVALTLSAALAAVTAEVQPRLGVLAVAGLMIWLLGFIFEVVADVQKSRFRAKPTNRGEFVRTGLWSWSRHPNYFGEIVLWLGIAIAAFPALSGWQYVTLVSPLFVAFLLIRVSGVPLLERKADSRWGGQADYEEYKASTPVLVPRPPSTTRAAD